MNRSASIPSILAKKIARRELSDEENFILTEWMALAPGNHRLYEELTNDTLIGNNLVDLMCVDRDSRGRNILTAIHRQKKRAYRLASVVATTLIGILLVWLWYAGRLSNNRLTDATKVLDDLAQYKHVCLETQNGDTYNLEGARRMIRAHQCMVDYPNRVKFQGGTDGSFNRITTPAIGQCIVELPDGTFVQLYKQSSIRFLADVNKSRVRVVELTGVAYFEVSPREHQPFEVIGMQGGKTLGTVSCSGARLIVYATQQQAVSALLLGGLANISNEAAEGTLKPEYTGHLDFRSNTLQEARTDTINALQWMNDFARFDNIQVKPFLDTVALYFNCRFEYEGDFISRKKLYRTIRRIDSVESILAELQRAGELGYTKMSSTLYKITPLKSKKRTIQ